MDRRAVVRRRIHLDLGKKFRNIQRIKERIVRKHGLEPTITFYYYAINPIDYVGEEWARKSLESILGQGDVVIVNYGSIDGLIELAEEYGVKVLDVEKEEHFFPESKLSNKAMFESKTNFMVYLNWNIIYPPNFADFCKEWLKTHDIKRYALRLYGQAYRIDDTLIKQYVGSMSFMAYRPFVLWARGYDERVYYNRGSCEYAIFLFKHLLRLKWDTCWIDMRHRYYTWWGRREYLWNKYNFGGKDSWGVYDIVEELFKNLDNTFESVENTYW